MPDTTDDNNRLEGHKVIAFAKNVDLVGQQKKSRLVSYVDADMAFSEPGDRFTDELMGLSDPVEYFGDVGDSPDGEVDKSRRWQFFKTFADGKFVGTRIKAEQLVDPTNPTVIAMGAGRERRRDEIIIKGFFASAYYTDSEGEIKSLAFPSAQKIAKDSWAYHKGLADGASAPTGDVGLTAAKLRSASILLDKSNIEDKGTPCIAVEQADLMGLLTTTEVTSSDYNNVKALVNGELDFFMGFKFVRVNAGRLPILESGIAGLPAWLPGVIKYKERPLVTTRIVERQDKRFRWYAYYEAQDACLRSEDAGVVQIAAKRY